MGVAIRHLSRLLAEVEARTKLLITLSDGRPDDQDGYRGGEYGIEDTRKALARHLGIPPTASPSTMRPWTIYHTCMVR